MVLKLGQLLSVIVDCSKYLEPVGHPQVRVTAGELAAFEKLRTILVGGAVGTCGEPVVIQAAGPALRPSTLLAWPCLAWCLAPCLSAPLAAGVA